MTLDLYQTNGSSPPQYDVRVDLHDSIATVRPIDPEAQVWLDENVDERATWFAGSLVVEPRFLSDIVCGLADAGFRVSGGKACGEIGRSLDLLAGVLKDAQ